MEQKKGFRYVYTKEQYEAYKKVPPWQKLERLEKMNRFIYYFAPLRGKEIREKLRKGEI